MARQGGSLKLHGAVVTLSLKMRFEDRNNSFLRDFHMDTLSQFIRLLIVSSP